MYKLVIALVLASNCAFADSSPAIIKDSNREKYASIHYFSKTRHEINFMSDQQRTNDFPTQLIRLNLDLSNKNISCDEINEAVDKVLLTKLKNQDITYLMAEICYPSEKADKYYTLSAFFDPQTDKAITYLQNYIAENNGKDFFGVPFTVEAVQGVVVSLKIREEIDAPQNKYKVLYSLGNKLYFKNLYEMDNTLITDIDNKLHTNDSELISSFITQWMGNVPAIPYYLEKLTDSDIVTTSTKFTFLLDTEPKAYGSPIFRLFSYRPSAPELAL